MRWSRPPVTSVTPRRQRERLTSATSRIGTPTSIAPRSSPALPAGALCATSITSAATRNPTSMLPPSPRKIFAGRARFQGRNAAEAPASANASPASPGCPLMIASTSRAGDADRRHRRASSVHVVHQIERVDQADRPDQRQRDVDGAPALRCASRGLRAPAPPPPAARRAAATSERSRTRSSTRPERPQRDSASEHDRQLPVERSARRRPDQPPDEHGGAPEQRRRRSVLAVLARHVVEVRALGDADRERNGDERRGCAGDQSDDGRQLSRHERRSVGRGHRRMTQSSPKCSIVRSSPSRRDTSGSYPSCSRALERSASECLMSPTRAGA